VLDPEDMKRLAELNARRNTLGKAEAAEWRQLHTAALPRAIEPYYSLNAPSVVPLYIGPLDFPPRHGGRVEQFEGTVSLGLTPRPQVVIKSVARRFFDIQDFLDGARTPQLPTMPALPPAPEGPLDGGDSSWLPPLQGYIAGKAAAAKTVTFHLVNFTDMHGTVISDGLNTWPGRSQPT